MLGFIRLMIRTFARPSKQQRPRTFTPVLDNTWDTTKKKAQSTAYVLTNLERLPEAKVVHVMDGDSLIVAQGRHRTEIRLDSIDCPEGGQDWGGQAKGGLINLVYGRRLMLEEHGLDDYGRTLATIYVWPADREEPMNVNEQMVMRGHAWVMRKYYDHLPPDRQAKLNRLETWARSKRVGLWGTENPIPPWQWRRKQGV
ncbi:MAG: thermonuclease family protein [Terricaulis sp.]